MSRPVARFDQRRTLPLPRRAGVHSFLPMSLFVAVSMLLMATPTPALATGAGGDGVAPGCTKSCEKKAVPCSDGRQDGQIMCVEIVSRCEIRCDAKRAGRKGPSTR